MLVQKLDDVFLGDFVALQLCVCPRPLYLPHFVLLQLRDEAGREESGSDRHSLCFGSKFIFFQTENPSSASQFYVKYRS